MLTAAARLRAALALAAGAVLLAGCSRPSGPPATARAGDVWRNPTDGQEMIFVPAGEFIMGSTPEEMAPVFKRVEVNIRKRGVPTDIARLIRTTFRSEIPRHTVYLDGYWIARTPVTVAQYRRFCKATGAAMPEAPEWGWKPDHPMVNVDWRHAEDYCRWAGAALPTEAQWERAARGTDGRIYPWGSQFDATKCVNSVDVRVGSTEPVGSKPAGASPSGCLDMPGNVFEWCADWFGEAYYAASPPRNPTGPADGYRRVIRGAAWPVYLAHVFRAPSRYSNTADTSEPHIGFRTVWRPASP